MRFELCPHLSFGTMSQFEFLSLSQVEFLSFLTTHCALQQSLVQHVLGVNVAGY